ncbi:MAG: hypothetical protein DKM50_08675 [Candidatus Margulisiibacteriota bacterium]|nr:MAG: hypothetical protein A2X43_11770 [Candidatus Margulisbacteria bacterium GWD2_39_127]OGI01818.1 MAG: hypothetical protein A2X42_04295 [Candidatus Margulisbacteria bacterium GWF2_38_17]OGI10140.1 MAG: hypothetical protein A2X41_01015 [Candidatus Margulisbacteria bacterium GWE2_39_32]PZM79523.1 MAG: hypothetical protein DKM50_08675 [Candidatus Margulisiibacteriota bacterium]HAR63804.1 hypothetical protein [Candidatus Margulisiibacteriota bacterium]
MGNKILLVDDEDNILSSYKRMLKNKYIIETAAGGAAALAVLNTRGPFSVVICDYKMPGMNGIQFLAEIKDLFPDTIRIMLTGQADLNMAIDAVNEGNIFRFLTKPCDSELLEKSILAAFRQHELIMSERELHLLLKKIGDNGLGHNRLIRD